MPDLPQILDDITEHICKYVTFPNPHHPTAVTLWVAHTWALETAETSPYLAITAPEKQSGKTRLLEVVKPLVRNPRFTANISPAALFRLVEKEQPTLLMDELDTIWKGRDPQADALRNLINAGHRRGNTVIRTLPPKHNPIEFQTFCPKALAGIGQMPETVTDRAIPIRLERQIRGQGARKYRRRNEPEADPLRQHLENAIYTHIDPDLEYEPGMPDQLPDRAADNWEPLIAIADLASQQWANDARDAAKALSDQTQDTSEESHGIRLLADIREAFRNDERITSKDLRARLLDPEDSMWRDIRGADLSYKYMGKLLHAYGIKAKPIRVHGVAAKGYERTDFEFTWRRYLEDPRNRKQSDLRLHTGYTTTESIPDRGEHKFAVTKKPPLSRDVTGVTANDIYRYRERDTESGQGDHSEPVAVHTPKISDLRLQDSQMADNPDSGAALTPSQVAEFFNAAIIVSPDTQLQYRGDRRVEDVTHPDVTNPDAVTPYVWNWDTADRVDIAGVDTRFDQWPPDPEDAA